MKWNRWSGAFIVRGYQVLSIVKQGVHSVLKRVEGRTNKIVSRCEFNAELFKAISQCAL